MAAKSNNNMLTKSQGNDELPRHYFMAYFTSFNPTTILGDTGKKQTNIQSLKHLKIIITQLITKLNKTNRLSKATVFKTPVRCSENCKMILEHVIMKEGRRLMISLTKSFEIPR